MAERRNFVGENVSMPYGFSNIESPMKEEGFKQIIICLQQAGLMTQGTELKATFAGNAIRRRYPFTIGKNLDLPGSNETITKTTLVNFVISQKKACSNDSGIVYWQILFGKLPNLPK